MSIKREVEQTNGYEIQRNIFIYQFCIATFKRMTVFFCQKAFSIVVVKMVILMVTLSFAILDKKPYECNVCHKGFVRRWDFYRHVNSVHHGKLSCLLLFFLIYIYIYNSYSNDDKIR